MKTFYLVLLLVIQGSVIYGEISDEDSSGELKNTLDDDEVDEKIAKDIKNPKTDWVDMFSGPNINLYPTSATTLMAQATYSDKSPEEQLDEIKEMANQITMMIQSEMTNLLSFAIGCIKKNNTMNEEDNKFRKKRSTETPMDSTKLIMRLLNHIKSNNEYQNIAIEKMMTAQEIADKYGIPFNPDTEILSDLAKAANTQALEMTSILKDSCDLKNSSQCDISEPKLNGEFQNTSHSSEKLISSDAPVLYDFVPYDYEEKHAHIPSNYNFYHASYDNQIPSPPTQQKPTAPVSQKPNFYDTISYNPQEYSYCSMEPITMPPIYSPFDEFIIDPLLVGEEFEETVSSKILLEHDPLDPGSGSVNHVTTYTISEKAHFKNPQIENLPEQMQYYFLLV